MSAAARNARAESFPHAAPEALANAQLRSNLRAATTSIRARRAGVVAEVADWEELREAGAAIKDDALGRLDERLVELEQAVVRAGGVVHWARDAAEANELVTGLVRDAGADEVVKVKSLTTDEIRLDEALAAAGVTPIETDLAELIVQLAGERPSHLLVPALHKNRTEIRDLFREQLGLPGLSDDPAELAEAARLHLRAAFLRARVAISGANFAVAETGTVCVVESEGNGRMCTTLPEVLITVMGIEKVIPAWRDLGVMLQLLPRSSTGERMNPYTSLWTGVREGDGPRAFHLVLLDAGRTRVLADRVGRDALRCIRCSACINVCPVYRQTGGHAYHTPYAGPIGAILAPQLEGEGRRGRLAAVRLVAVRRLLRRLPGQDRHPVDPRARAGEGGAARARRGRRRGRCAGSAGPSPRGRATSGPSGSRGAGSGSSCGTAGCRRFPPGAARRLGPLARPAGRARRDVPRVVGAACPAVMRCSRGCGPPCATRLPRSRCRAPTACAARRARPRSCSVSWSACATTGQRSSRAPTRRLPPPRRCGSRAPFGSSSHPTCLPRCGLRASSWSRTTASPRRSSTALDGALTTCALACADTGTIALDGGPGQGRRAISLVPDLHVCVVRRDQVVETVPELIEHSGRARRRAGRSCSSPARPPRRTSASSASRASTARAGSL